MMDSEQFYRSMLESIYEGVYFVDKSRRITFWNKGAERITGFLASEVMHSFCYDNILNHINSEGIQLCLLGCPLHQTVSDGIMRETAVYLHHKQGHRIPVTGKTIAIYEGNEVIGAVEVFVDDSEKHRIVKNMEDLKVLAMRDQLTGLPNRRYINTLLASKMNEFLSLGIPFGVAFMDIDNFKKLNDTYGHDMGDEVLKTVAMTYSGNVRTPDFVGRWGGEEFIAVFSDVDEDELWNVTEKLRVLIENSALRKKDQCLRVTISIGATLIRQDDTIEEVIKRADQLLYKSKLAGKNQVTIEQMEDKKSTKCGCGETGSGNDSK